MCGDTEVMKPLAKEIKMRTFKFFAFALVLALVVFLQPTSTAAPGNNPSATGHYNISIFGGLQTVSFNAIQHKDGTAAGSLVVDSRGQSVRLKAVITCLNIFSDGKTAELSGRVTQTNTPSIPRNSIVLLKVVDNGEGNNDPSDLVSDVFGFPPSSLMNCNSSFFPNMFVPDAGNIQVRP
jgi:hypothetical protein